MRIGTNNKFLLGESVLDFQLLGQKVTELQVVNTIQSPFNGKDDFVKFYRFYNGAFFPDSVELSRSSFYEVGEFDFDSLGVECFYTIAEDLEEMWELTREHSPEAKVFAETHFPFAADCAGNEFFIEMPTGYVKYVSWEYGIPEGVVIAAPNFKDFCLALKV